MVEMVAPERTMAPETGTAGEVRSRHGLEIAYAAVLLPVLATWLLVQGLPAGPFANPV